MKTYFLIELKQCSSLGPVWYAGPWEFCNCANHAVKYLTRAAAEADLASFQVPDDFHVTEHGWG